MEDLHESPKAVYNRLAPVYDRLWAGYVRETVGLLLEAAAVQPGEKVLDVACGTGAVEAALVERTRTASVTGIDVSEGMLRVARGKLAGHPSVSFLNAAAEALPFPDETFDVVVCASALHYFQDPGTAFREMYRTLRPGGRAVLLDWRKDDLLMRTLDRWLRLADPAHERCYSEGELAAFFERAGFGEVATEHHRARWIWSIMVGRGLRP